MSKCIIVSKIFYCLSIFGFVTYLITNKSAYMAIGGFSLIVASSLVIIDSKKNK